MTSAGGRALAPGRPGRGDDPTAGLTDMQWYMYHQRNVAYFAAFATEDFTVQTYLPVLRGTLEAAPHFAIGFGGGTDRPLDDALLRRLIAVETVPDFGGLPDRWLDDGLEVFDDLGLPMIRVRIARRAGGPDAEGRRSFVVVRAAHPFTEGIDSALLTRSERSGHEPAPPPPKSPPLVTAGARVLGGLAALMHLVVSRLWTPHPGRIRVVTRVYPRKLMSEIARRLGVSHRALFVALTAHVIAGAALPGARRKVTSTYSTLKPGGGANRDSFIRMRMLFAAFENRDDFADYARGVDARLAAEGGESGFNAEMNAAAIGFHRGLARFLPGFYGPKVFAFMPYDFVFALLPPHRLAGR